MTMFVLQSALLLAIAFVLGCIAGCLLRGWLAPVSRGDASSALAATAAGAAVVPEADGIDGPGVAAVDGESTSAESALVASSLVAHRASRGVRDGSGTQEWEARALPAGRVASPQLADRSGGIFSPGNDIVPRSQ